MKKILKTLTITSVALSSSLLLAISPGDITDAVCDTIGGKRICIICTAERCHIIQEL